MNHVCFVGLCNHLLAVYEERGIDRKDSQGGEQTLGSYRYDNETVDSLTNEQRRGRKKER